MNPGLIDPVLGRGVTSLSLLCRPLCLYESLDLHVHILLYIVVAECRESCVGLIHVHVHAYLDSATD